jgi:hypothetical protein
VLHGMHPLREGSGGVIALALALLGVTAAVSAIGLGLHRMTK